MLGLSAIKHKTKSRTMPGRADMRDDADLTLSTERQADGEKARKLTA